MSPWRAWRWAARNAGAWAGLALLLAASPPPALAEDGGEPPGEEAPSGEDEGDDAPPPKTPDEAPAPTEDARDEAGEGPAPEVTETVTVTATGEPRLLSRSPLPVRVIDQKAIQRTAAADAAELLSRAPGVPVMAQGVDQRGGVSGISLQGVPAGRTLVLVDGRPLVGDTGGIVDLGQVPVGQLEKVEIVEGPMSSLYGSEALGGVVNLITRTPTGGVRLGGRLQGATTGAVDGAVTLDAGAGALSSSTALTARFHPSLDLDPSEPTTDLDQRSAIALRERLRLQTGPARTELILGGSHDRRAGTVDRSRAVAGSPQEVWRTPKTNDRLNAAVVERVELGSWGELRLRLDGTAWLSTFGQDLADSPVVYDRRTTLLNLNQLSRLDLFALPWLRGAVGVELKGEQLSIRQDRVEPGGAKEQRIEIQGERTGAVEPWAQGNLRLFSDRLELVGGVRLSVHDAYGFTAAPSLAVRVDLWRNATLRVSGGRGYRAPSLKDRYLQFDHTALGYVVLGTPELRPESSWGANLSLSQRIPRLGQVSVGGFAHRIRDLITQVLDGSASVGDYAGLNVFRTTNVEGARTAGAQLTGELGVSWIRGTAAYRFLWAWDDDGFFLPDAPIHGLRGTFEVEVPWAGTSVYTSAGWESERFVDRTQSLRSPGMVLWDARLEQRLPLPEELSLYAGVDNILDQHRDPNREGDFRPVTGRRFVLGVRGALTTGDPSRRPGARR